MTEVPTQLPHAAVGTADQPQRGPVDTGRPPSPYTVSTSEVTPQGQAVGTKGAKTICSHN